MDLLRSAVKKGSKLRVKRWGSITTAALLAVLAMVIGACGSSDSGDTTETSGAGQSVENGNSDGDNGAKSTGDGKSSDTYRIAALISGTKTDNSWGNDIVNGAEKAAGATGAELRVVENLSQPTQYLQEGEAFARQGYDLIIMGNGAASEPTQTLAAQYPDSKFIFLGGGITDVPDNVLQITLVQGEGDFVAGTLAGLMTETNKVGAVVGSTQPRLVAQTQLFILGARATNPDVDGTAIQINTWDDPSKARAAAEALAAQDRDIIFSATEQATQGLYPVAQDEDNSLRWVIPQYMDNFSLAPDVVLTTVVYNLEGFLPPILESAADGDWEGGKTITPGVGDGIGLLAPYHDNAQFVPQEVQDRVKRIQDAVADGSLVVPDMGSMGSMDAGMTMTPPELPE